MCGSNLQLSELRRSRIRDSNFLPVSRQSRLFMGNIGVEFGPKKTHVWHYLQINVNTSSFSEVAKWRCPEEELKQNPKRRSQMKIRNDRYSEAERVFQVSWTVEGLIYKKHQRSRILNTWENWVGWLVWSRATMRASAERLRADLTFWSQGLEEEWDLGAFKKMTWMHGWSWRLPRQSVGWNSVICQNQFSQHQKAAAKWGKILIRWTCSREMPLDGRHQ